MSDYITAVGQLIDEIDSMETDTIKAEPMTKLLFRGQPCDKPLLPKIARANCNIDTTKIEIKMLKELKRRTAKNPERLGRDDWDALVIAQHFGMATRLLDWTVNPLIALWFAVSDQKFKSEGYLFMILATEDMLLDRTKNIDPFNLDKIYAFEPSIINTRLRTQASWFTIDGYSKNANKFIAVEENNNLKHHVFERRIKGTNKIQIMHSLDRLGINQESIFPGLEGACKYIDWRLRSNQYLG